MDLQHWVDQGYDESIHNPIMRGEDMVGFAAKPVAIPIDIITRRAFMKRFTLEERTALRESADVVVKDFLYELDLAQDVTLSLVDNRSALDYIVSIGLLGAHRVDEILVPGTPEEV